MWAGATPLPIHYPILYSYLLLFTFSFLTRFIYLWPPYVIGGPLYFCPVVSFLPSFFFFLLFFSLPNLSGRRSDVCHTSTHGVALVRIENAGLKCAARGSLQIQDAKKSP